MNSKIQFPYKLKAYLLRLILAGVLSLTLMTAGLGQTFQVAAAPATNDEFPGTTVPALPFDDMNVDTTVATSDITTNPPGDTFVDPNSIILGDCNSNQGEASVWYNFTPTSNITVYVETTGSNYDTLLAVWRGDPENLTLVSCHDDNSSVPPFNNQSKIGFFAQAGTTYYIEVIEWTEVASLGDLEFGGTLDFHMEEGQFSVVDVHIAGTKRDSLSVPFDTSTMRAYELNDGPVRISSINSENIISSERVVWGSGFDELMGYPADQLTNEYVFPFYNNKAMNSQLRIGNTGNVAADVDVYIGGTKMNTTPYNIAVGGSVRVQYAGVNDGPVRVVTATSGATILATMRVIWGAGYDELRGYPADQLTNDYVFPFYNNKAMSSQLRIGNTGGVAAEVDVYIGGTKINTTPYNIAVGDNLRVEYAGVNNGPVRVVTETSGATILATMRVIWGKGYDELMGYPADQLTNEYVFPLYSNTSLNSQLRIGNTGTVPAVVDVYIGGVKLTTTPLNIAVGGNSRVQYTGVESGPVRVVTQSIGASILVTERIIYGTTGYDELMGYPAVQLRTEYLFPWYNNKAMQSQIPIGSP
jgi:hypothetical protein